MSIIALKRSNVLESGYYKAQLVDVKVVVNSTSRYVPEPYEQFEWVWSLELKPKAKPIEFRTWTSLNCSKGTKLFKLLAALQYDLGDDTNIDTDVLLGRTCRINIEKELRTDGTDKNTVVGYALPID